MRRMARAKSLARSRGYDRPYGSYPFGPPRPVGPDYVSEAVAVVYLMEREA